jgi:hypothetical protein
MHSTLCSCLHPPVTSSPLGPNVLLRTLFSNTLNLCFYLQLRYQLLQSYKTRGKIIFPWLQVHNCVHEVQFLQYLLFPTNRLRVAGYKKCPLGHCCPFRYRNVFVMYVRPCPAYRDNLLTIFGDNVGSVNTKLLFVCITHSTLLATSVHLNPSRTEVWNYWIFKPTPTIHLHGILLWHNFVKCHKLQLSLIPIFW